MKKVTNVVWVICFWALLIKTCTATKIIDMSAISNWSMSSTIFWVLWGIEAAFMSWWLLDELKLQYIGVNPFVYWCWLWLIVAAILHLSNLKVAAFILVAIAAIPLAIMGVFFGAILIVSLFSGPIRWN